MKYLRILILFVVTYVTWQSTIYAQGVSNNCATALPFCTGTTYNFPLSYDGSGAGQGPQAEAGPAYNCLSSTPSPVWYYFKINQPGNLDIHIASTANVDVDFCCWGPFSNISAACGSNLTTGNMVDCSYSTSTTEDCNISNALTGQYYMMVITNFANVQTNVEFSQTAGTGSTDCSIISSNISNNGPLCVGQTLQLSAQPVANGAFSWTGPNGFTSSLQNPTIPSVAAVDAGTYYCIVTANGSSSPQYSTVVVINPDITISATDQTICSGISASVTASGAINYSWNTGPTTNPLVVSPATTTTYTVTGTDANGCSGTADAVVTVNPIPLSTFNVVSPVCENANCDISYTGTQLAGATYTWSFDGGTLVSGSAQGPYQIKWTAAGTKNVTLSVTANSCTSTLTTIPVTVNPTPSSAFTSSSLSICTYDSSIVTYTGVQIPGANYIWNFDGGMAIPGTGAGPHEIEWASAGTKNITLTVSANNCTSTETSIAVTVNPEPTSNFTALSPVCENANSSISYTGSQIVGATYTWNFDGGTTVSGGSQGPYQIMWAAAGTKNISLLVTANGCTSTLTTIPVTVNPAPTSAFFASPTTICTYDSSVVIFTGTQIPGANYNWNFDGGSAITGIGPGPHVVEWLNAGTKNITLIVSANGCTSTQSSVSVIVNPVPTSTFIATPTTVCENQQLTISNTGTQLAGSNYNWNFNGGTATPGAGVGPHDVSWAIAGTKIVTLTVITSGCSSSQTSVNITVNPMPTSAFIINPSTICTYDTALAIYTGMPIGGATYAWNFNGGTAIPGNGQGPHKVKWANGGTKNITLTVSAAGCTSSQTTQTVTVNTVPESNFMTDPNSVCIGDSSEITFLSNPLAGATYSWDFAGGNAIPGVGAGPHHISWANSGVMNIGLIVTANGCVSNLTNVPVTVKVIPTSNFTVVSPVCANSNSDITYIGPAPASSTFQWDFAGGIVVTDTSGNHVKWNTAGTHNVSLTVIQNGCSSTATAHPVRVTSNPSSSFSVKSPVCINSKDSVIFNALPPGTPPGSNAAYYWSFGNSGSGISANPGTGAGPHLLTFSIPGDFIITLVVTDSACASQLTTKNIRVSPVPTSDFTTTSKVCAFDDGDVAFTGQAGNSAIFHWDFDEGIVTSGQGRGPYKVNWETDSVHTISLVVIENNCFSDTSFAPIIVNPLPTVQFTADQFKSCGISTVKFKNLTLPVAQSCIWNFGDSLSTQNTSQVPNPTHIYYIEGVYTVTLSVISMDNCKSSSSIFNMIQIYQKPDETVIVHPEIGSLDNPEIDFFSSSTYNNVVKWTWNFDDPLSGLFNTSSEENPKHVFSTVDTFKVILIVESEHQCKDTVKQEVIIKDIYTIYLPNAFTPNGDLLNDEFGPMGQYYDPNSYLFTIYDRWGEEVFKTNDFDKKWDGKSNGGKKVAQASLFNWIIVVKETNGIKHKYLGQVLLIP